MRPIFMSMLTSVGGMLPLVLIPGSGTELYRGLGAVVVGGLFVSTLFTLFVTPAMLSLVMDAKQKLGFRLRPDAATEHDTSDNPPLPRLEGGAGLKRLLPVIVGTLVVAGCAVGPEHVEPSVRGVPDAYAVDLSSMTPSTQPSTRPVVADVTAWWSRLNDPQLTAVVEEALMRSPDVEEALAIVLESRAMLAAERGERLPDVNLTAGYTRSRSSRNLDGFAQFNNSSGGGTTLGGSFGDDTDLFSLGIGEAWELDVFGRLSRRVQAAGRQFQADQFDLADIQVTLAADVAGTYVEVRELQSRLGIALENVAIQRRSLELAQAISTAD